MSKLTYANIIREAVLAVSTDAELLAWCNALTACLHRCETILTR